MDGPRNNAALAFDLADLELVAATQLPAGAELSLDQSADYAEEVATLIVEAPCPVWGLGYQQVAAFYREGAGVRLDVGEGPQSGGRSLLVGTVAEALSVCRSLLPSV